MTVAAGTGVVGFTAGQRSGGVNAGKGEWAGRSQETGVRMQDAEEADRRQGEASLPSRSGSVSISVH